MGFLNWWIYGDYYICFEMLYMNVKVWLKVIYIYKKY